MSRKIEIYTDGSATNGIDLTDNKGGYGIVFINGVVKQYCGGSYTKTTSARMEIYGLLKALQKCKLGDHVTVYMDNKYCVDTLEQGWIFKWSLENWRKRSNADLWKQVLKEYTRLERKVRLQWIRGHDKIQDHNYYNHVADILASRGANRTIKIKDL